MRKARPNLLSRRQLFSQMLGAGLCFPLRGILTALTGNTLQVDSHQADSHQDERPASPETMPILSAEDDLFLDELERANFQYFWDQGSPNTGMVKDRCDVRTGRQDGGGQHRGHRLRTDRLMHWRASRLHLPERRAAAGVRHAALSLEKASLTIGDFSSTSPMRRPESGCSIPRFRPSIRRFCCVGFWLAASTSGIAGSLNWST